MRAVDFVGTPYSKLDCFALVREVARVCYGLNLPKLVEYSPDPRAVTISALQDKRWVEIPLDEAHAGDVITLSPNDAPAPHVGIIIENGWVLHNDKKLGCIIQSSVNLRRRGYIYRKVYRWLA